MFRYDPHGGFFSSLYNQHAGTANCVSHVVKSFHLCSAPVWSRDVADELGQSDEESLEVWKTTEQLSI